MALWGRRWGESCSYFLLFELWFVFETERLTIRFSIYSQAALDSLTQKKFDFLPFPELEKAVVEDVEFIKQSELVPDSVVVSGWVYEVETGKTRRVV